jgi:dipeptidyl aminopeptidase/acylaminoacyl peptidase
MRNVLRPTPTRRPAALLAAALLFTLAGACATGRPDRTVAEVVAEEPAPVAELIPRAVLFGNPERTRVRLSPDGRRLSFLAPLDGVMNVWIAPVDDVAAATPVTNDRGRGIAIYAWAFTGDDILYLQDRDGDENWRLHRVDLAAGEDRDLTPFPGVQTQVIGVSHRHPESVVVAWNDRDPQWHELYRVSLEDGAWERIQENARFGGFLVDDDFRVRLAVEMTEDGGEAYFRPGATPGAGAWEPVFVVPMEDTLGTRVLDFAPDGDSIWMLDSHGRDTAALVAFDPATGERRVAAESGRADIGPVLLHPTTKEPQAAAFNWTRLEWIPLDERVRADLSRLTATAQGDVEITSRTLDDRQWIAAFSPDDGPVRYYHLDRDSGRVRYLFSDRPALEGQRLARMYPVVIPARDGLPLVSYLTLPPAVDRDGRATQPVPMVLLVHGGPWARDTWGFSPLHQWLASRGYAVLSVNFRGSTGFGKAFVNAGNLAWARAMHDDLIDAVDWAVEQGAADPDQVCIMGGSYGGYATLVGLTFTPERFACGVDIVGPSSLLTLLASIPPYWKPMFELFAKRVGDPRTPEGEALLRERSPLFRTEEIRAPLLIGQGANDPRVKQAESDQLVEALRERDVPVTYVLYPDEGHGFRRPENRLSFFAITEAFLARHLGGRLQPLGPEDFEGSSALVPEGGRHVPGLTEALPAATP